MGIHCTPLDALMILRSALEGQMDMLQKRFPCKENSIIPFDEPARILAMRMKKRIQYLMHGQRQSESDATKQTCDEFQYEVRTCGIRLLQATVMCQE